jgi:flagellar basal-body rod protein FlgC
MNMFSALEISASAMRAERIRAEVVTANLANAETTRTEQGGPYQRKQVVFAAGRFLRTLGAAGAEPGASGVRTVSVVADPTPAQLRYEPSHPDANEQGFVAYPAINPVAEMADLMSAVRSYQMNASAVNATKQMIQQSLEMLR